MAKEMTKAMAETMAYRDAVNAGKCKAVAKDWSSVVYFYDTKDGKPAAAGYSGRSRKVGFRFCFRTEASRVEYVSKWMQERAECYNIRKRKTDPRVLAVGDVLVSMRGYGQTNINYYMVLSLVGRSSVELVAIGQDRQHAGAMQGTCTPNKNKTIGESFKKRASGNSVRIGSGWARKINPTESSCWTAYA